VKELLLANKMLTVNPPQTPMVEVVRQGAAGKTSY
jgi:hypothetical protein